MVQITSFKDLWNYLGSMPFLNSVMVAAIGLMFLYVIKQFLIKKVAYTSKDEQHKNTFFGIIFSILQYVVVIIAIVLILQFHGVNVASILAGLGLMSLVIGLALQDMLKDIIAGINIYNNNFYKVGDLVRYNGEECDVKYFNARVTKFQSILTRSTYTVCNSQITAIEKIKDYKYIDFAFPFDTKKETVEECMESICERMRNECEHIKIIYYDGISKINETGVLYELKYSCPAHKGEETSDKLSEVAYEEMHKYKIAPVFNALYNSESFAKTMKK
ncbi:MAG: mechanosensitive ion channel [Erysipelotrichaceae bacterium]|nr:mechanosensitive ion channel [Erysipelotrichaceae bacterium]